MLVFLTGATSKIGRKLLQDLLAHPLVTAVYALTRSAAQLENEKKRFQNKLIVLEGDLLNGNSIDPPKMDLCIHLAALTHSQNEQDYFEINYKATVQLARTIQFKGCQRIFFVSSQTAGEDAGAYALSKFLAEKALLEMSWQQIVIIRPSEIVGAGSKEGLDQFANLARRYKIYPWLLGSFMNLHQIVFSPLSAEAFNLSMMNSIFSEPLGKKIQVVRGPSISSTQLAIYFFKKYRALPIPVYLPWLHLLTRLLAHFGLQLIPKDQIPRLLGKRWQKPKDGFEIEDLVLPNSMFLMQSKK